MERKRVSENVQTLFRNCYNASEFFQIFISLNLFFFQFKDTRIAWTEGMTSIYLAQIFSSFNEDFPMDHPSRLFILNLLKEDFLQELEIDIKSLKDGVVLTKQIFCTTGAIPMHAYVFEVNVNIDGDNFCVDNKV